MVEGPAHETGKNVRLEKMSIENKKAYRNQGEAIILHVLMVCKCIDLIGLVFLNVLKQPVRKNLVRITVELGKAASNA